MNHEQPSHEHNLIAAEVPFRERLWADHDEPWQYQRYHLSDKTKLSLLRNRDRMLAGEYDPEYISGSSVSQQDTEQHVVSQPTVVFDVQAPLSPIMPPTPPTPPASAA